MTYLPAGLDEAAALLLKTSLDNKLSGRDPRVGIAFGVGAFELFRKRGWFSLETFGVLGTTLFQMKLPAYAKTHYVFETWDLDDLDIQVGEDPT